MMSSKGNAERGLCAGVAGSRWAAAVAVMAVSASTFGAVGEVPALELAGRRSFGLGDYTQAAEHWSAAVALEPDSVKLHNRLGMALTKLKRHREAEAEFKAAAAVDPGAPEPLFNLGLLHLHRGDLDQAEKTLHRAVRAASWYPEAHYHLGLIAESRGNLAQAVEEYTRELNVNAGCAKAWLRLKRLQAPPNPPDASAGLLRGGGATVLGIAGFGLGLACLWLSRKRAVRAAALMLLVAVAGSARGEEVDYAAYRQAISSDALKDKLTKLSSHPSRVLGYEGCERAAEYIESEFARIGLSDVKVDTFTAPMPIGRGASVTVASSGKTLRVHPLWPNLVRAPVLPDGGITGHLIDAGNGEFASLDGMELQGSIALLDMATRDRFVDLRVLGVRVVLFPEPDTMSRGEAELKFLDSPVNVPRFWVPRAAAAELRKLAKSGKEQVRVESKVEWRAAEGRNIYGYLEGRKSGAGKLAGSAAAARAKGRSPLWPIVGLVALAWLCVQFKPLREHVGLLVPALVVFAALAVVSVDRMMAPSPTEEGPFEEPGPGGAERDEDLLVLEAYYDSMSIVPSLSPGAEQATGVAALLALAEVFAERRPEKSVLFLATSGHCRALTGVSEFMLSHCRDEKFWKRISNPAFRARLKDPIDFDLFIGLDLSSHTDRLGVFHEGHFTTLGQRATLANRRFFAPYGQKFTQYAKRLVGQRVLAKLEQEMKAKGQTLAPGVRLAADTIISEFASFSVPDVPRWSRRGGQKLTEQSVEAAVDAMVAAGIIPPATKYVVNPARFPMADHTRLFSKKKLGLWPGFLVAVGLQRPVPVDLPVLPRELQPAVEVIARQGKPFKPSELKDAYDKLLAVATDRLLAYRPAGTDPTTGRIGKGIDPQTCTLAEIKPVDKKLYASTKGMLTKYGFDDDETDGLTLGGVRAAVERVRLMPEAVELLERDGSLLKSYAYKAESFLDNGITPVGGVIWQSYIPGLLALDSEVLVKMALPGMSFVSVNDNRRFVDTPLDTVDRVDVDKLTVQTRHLACMLAHALNDERFYLGTKVKLRDQARAVRGQVVEFRIGQSLLPDYPVDGVLAVLRDPNTQLKGQWEKTYMGVRGALMAMTDREGYFELPFVFTRSVSVEAYKVDPASGEIVYAADRGPEGDGTYPLIVPMDWRLKESRTVVFSCRTLDIFDLFDPRYLRTLDTINVLGPLDFAPLRYGYSELSGRGASVFFEEHERVKVVMGSGVFGIQYLLTNVQPTPAAGFVAMHTDGPAARKIRIPKGLRVATPDGLTYETTEQVFLSKGATRALAPVRCTTPGTAGNVAAGALTRFATAAPPGISRVTNERAIDTGDDNPTGVGFTANRDAALFRTAHLAAKNMHVLNESRIVDLRRYGIRNQRLERLHSLAGAALDMAREADSQKRYGEYVKHVRAARGFEAKAYPDVRGTANDTVKGIIFYFALLLPFAFFIERLLFGFPDIRKRIAAAAGVFVLAFIILRFVHPAFRLSTSPYIIFLAFLLLAMAAFVITIVVTKFNEQIAEMRRKAAKVHEADVGRLSASAAAFNLGISNMRKRKLRTALTTATLILLTFTVLSFTSVNTYTRFNRIPIRPEPEWFTVSDQTLAKLRTGKAPESVAGKLTALKGRRFESDDALREAAAGLLTDAELHAHWSHIREYSKKPHYRGMLVRDRNWNYLEDIAYEYVFSGFTHEPEDVVFALRSWYMSSTREGELHIRIEAPTGLSTFAVAAVGMTPQERYTTGIDSPDYMVAGKWLEEGDDRVCLLPSTMADRLGITAADVGKKSVTILGEPFLVKGILASGRLSRLVDVDNEQLSPVDLSAEDPQFDPNESAATLRGNATDIRTFTHLDPSGCVFMPYRVVIEHGGMLRSISVRLGDSVDFEGFLGLVKKFMSRVGMTIFVSDGERVEAYSSMGLSSFSGLGNLFIPIAIAGLIVLNTMMGAVHERFREIGIYSSVGLAPVHIGALFLAESCVYAVVGAIAGYLVGQVVGTLVAGLGLLPGITLNYSSLSAVASTFIVMAVVILSTLYPAKVASSMAVPDVTRKWKFPAPEGDDWTFDFPFTVASTHVLGLYVFLSNYFDGYKEESVGSFYTDHVGFLSLESKHGRGYLIRMTAWLAPFDMGISQDVELRALPTEDAGIARIQVFIHRLSGEMSAWQRMNKGFLTEIRKQFLIWRTVPESVKLEYAEQGRRLLDDLVTQPA